MVKLAGEIGYETHRKQKLTLNSVWSIAPPYGTIPIGTFWYIQCLCTRLYQEDVSQILSKTSKQHTKETKRLLNYWFFNNKNYSRLQNFKCFARYRYIGSSIFFVFLKFLQIFVQIKLKFKKGRYRWLSKRFFIFCIVRCFKTHLKLSRIKAFHCSWKWTLQKNRYTEKRPKCIEGWLP